LAGYAIQRAHCIFLTAKGSLTRHILAAYGRSQGAQLFRYPALTPGHRRYMLPINISWTNVKQEFCREAQSSMATTPPSKCWHHSTVYRRAFFRTRVHGIPWMVCRVHYSPFSSLSHVSRVGQRNILDYLKKNPNVET